MPRRHKPTRPMTPREQAESRRVHSLKRRQQRARAKARSLGLATTPNWCFYSHPPACACYDCLWTDPLAPAVQGRQELPRTMTVGV